MNVKVFKDEVLISAIYSEIYFKIKWIDEWIKGWTCNKANMAKYYRI